MAERLPHAGPHPAGVGRRGDIRRTMRAAACSRPFALMPAGIERRVAGRTNPERMRCARWTSRARWRVGDQPCRCTTDICTSTRDRCRIAVLSSPAIASDRFVMACRESAHCTVNCRIGSMIPACFRIFTVHPRVPTSAEAVVIASAKRPLYSKLPDQAGVECS